MLAAADGTRRRGADSAVCGDARDVHAVCGPQHDPRYGFRDIVHATYRFHSGAVATISGGLSFPLHAFRESQGPW